MKYLSGNKGFTLIELIVVLVILGILMMLAIVYGTNSADAAREKTCAYNRKGLYGVALVYAMECRDLGIALPPSTDAADLGRSNNAIGRALVIDPPKCPDGGDLTITWKPATLITCSIHGSDNSNP